MKKFLSASIFPFLVLFISFSSVSSSQIPNHIRVALLALNDERTPAYIQSILKKHVEYYKAGSAGPDVMYIIGTITKELDHGIAKVLLGTLYTDFIEKKLNRVPFKMFASMANHSHYKKTGKFLQNMLRMANEEKDKEKREKYLAYSLGWMTHYYVDLLEHQLVNRYGGNYAVEGGQERHDTLEMFEAAHVFEMSFNMNLWDYQLKGLAVPLNFVLRVFRETYPRFSERALIEFFEKEIILPQKIIEHHTTNVLKEYCNQDLFNKMQGIITQIKELNIPTAFRTGVIPLRLEYFDGINPVHINIENFDHFINAKPGTASFYADINWTITDHTLLIAYISEWYAVNEKARDFIVTKLRSISPDLETGSKDHWPFPDWNIDSGFPAPGIKAIDEKEERAAIETAKLFRNVDQLELSWKITSKREEVLSSGEMDINLSEGKERELNKYRKYAKGYERADPPMRIYFKAKESFFYFDNQPLTLKVSLRMKNNSPNSNSENPYIMGYRFRLPGGGVKPILPPHECKGSGGIKRVDAKWRAVEDTDEYEMKSLIRNLTERLEVGANPGITRGTKPANQKSDR